MGVDRSALDRADRALWTSVRDPISGELVGKREPLPKFAARHGWTVRALPYNEWLFEKDGASVFVYPSGGVVTKDAGCAGISISSFSRERIEAYLAGVACLCDSKVAHGWEVVVSPDCSIHLADENED